MPSDDDIAAYIADAARLLDLPLHEEWHPAVRENLAVILKHAAAVSEFPLSDDAEPAPVFKA